MNVAEEPAIPSGRDRRPFARAQLAKTRLDHTGSLSQVDIRESKDERVSSVRRGDAAPTHIVFGFDLDPTEGIGRIPHGAQLLGQDLIIRIDVDVTIFEDLPQAPPPFGPSVYETLPIMWCVSAVQAVGREPEFPEAVNHATTDAHIVDLRDAGLRIAQGLGDGSDGLHRVSTGMRIDAAHDSSTAANDDRFGGSVASDIHAEDAFTVGNERALACSLHP